MARNDLESEMRILIDRAQIERVLVQYARGIDRCDPELIRACFHPDAVEEHGTFSGPAHEFVDFTLPRVSAWFRATNHCLCNIWIDVAGDVAVSEAHVLALHHYADADAELFMAGRYIDRFERRNDAWKIAHRQLVVDQLRRQALRAEALPADFAHFKRGARAPDDFVYARWRELPGAIQAEE